nr:immunoglobulin light chain junction region [Macaca mulatta]MOW14567.1 immunoglobulin light chain junction region [Macaca mulatta]
CMQATQVPWTF